MNFVRWKCGCIQIENEPIYVYYCEGNDYTDYRLREYCFDVNSDRVCEKPFEIVSDDEKKHILQCIRFAVGQAYDYRKFKQTLKDMIK